MARLFLGTAAVAVALTFAADSRIALGEEQGRYFSKKAYTPSPLPDFQQLKDRLPAPVYETETGWVDTYWRAWELAFRNFHEPPPGSGFVSQFIDAAFNETSSCGTRAL